MHGLNSDVHNINSYIHISRILLKVFCYIIHQKIHGFIRQCTIAGIFFGLSCEVSVYMPRVCMGEEFNYRLVVSFYLNYVLCVGACAKQCKYISTYSQISL